MDVKPKPKPKVIKSKSSNSTLIRSERKHKRSRTKDEFPPIFAKKRGVYVENKTTKSLDTGTNSSQTERMTPPPRPGKKRFLTSVLSILEKDTTGTEFSRTEAKKDRKVKITEEGTTKTINAAEDTFETESNTMTEKMSSKEVGEFVRDKKKKKYRSKILNDYINADKFEVLQSKKNQNVSNSPSIGSDFEREEINWFGFPKLVNDYGSEHRQVNDLVKQISEGRKPKEKVKILDKDPSTLVAEHKDDKKLYNFFVDILETTFSVYNVKTDFNNAASVASSKVNLEIDETVAKKLRFKNVDNQEKTDDVTQKPSKPFYTIRDSKADRDGDRIPDNFENKYKKRREMQTSTSPQRRRDARCRSPQKRPEVRSRSPQKKRLKSESFSYPRNRISPPTSRSAEISQRSSLYKKNKKRDLLNMLREQLKMDDYYYEEPQNLYDALKVMARNKRKCEKNLRFTSNKNPTDLQDDCMGLRRRKIMAPTSNFKPPKPINMRQSEINRNRLKSIKNYDSTDYEEPSNHSIEVYGFDYDFPTKKMFHTPKLKEFIMTYHSSDSESEENQRNLGFEH